MTMTGVRRIAPEENCPHPSDNGLPDNWPLDDCPHYYYPLPRLIAPEDNCPRGQFPPQKTAPGSLPAWIIVPRMVASKIIGPEQFPPG